MQLVFAGAGTSSNGLANTIYLLLRNPAQLEALRADPALVQPAIHEGVRCESPVFFTFRIPKVDVTIQGITIPAGEPVIVNLGGANRDPHRFQNPERFDIRSEEHTSELQSLMRISYAVFCLKKKQKQSSYKTLHQ